MTSIRLLYNQLNIFDPVHGQKLAEVGLSLAVETANAEHPKWSERCWQLFFQWLNRKPRYFEFMIEDFRDYVYSYGLIEAPKSDRAFGFLSVKAMKREMIEFSRVAKVKNKKAHATPANVWRKR